MDKTSDSEVKSSEQDDLFVTEADKRYRKLFRIQLFGWGIIALMLAVILLNLFGKLNHEVNKYIMISCVLAYAVYIVVRQKIKK